MGESRFSVTTSFREFCPVTDLFYDATFSASSIALFPMLYLDSKGVVCQSPQPSRGAARLPSSGCVSGIPKAIFGRQAHEGEANTGSPKRTH